jgi:hypothetical protein
MAQEVRVLRDELGRPLPSLVPTSASDQQSSSDATGSFSTLPDAQLSEQGESLPSDRLLTRSEALERGKRLREKSLPDPQDGGKNEPE